VHAFKIGKVDVRAAAMPEGKIQGTSAGNSSRVLQFLWNMDLTIQIPNIVFCDGGSEPECILCVELNSVILHHNLVTLFPCEVEKREEITAKVGYVKDIMENQRDTRFAINSWQEFHRPQSSRQNFTVIS
jgi:hypothetical protein